MLLLGTGLDQNPCVSWNESTSRCLILEADGFCTFGYGLLSVLCHPSNHKLPSGAKEAMSADEVRTSATAFADAHTGTDKAVNGAQDLLTQQMIASKAGNSALET